MTDERTGAAREPRREWFALGLRFTCAARCGLCCSGAPGFVWVTNAEIRAIAARLGLPLGAFGRRYLRHASGKVSLKERSNGDCAFLQRPAMTCAIYDVRPTQCRTYPFWPEILRSRERWDSEADVCPGVGAGELHPCEACAAKAAETRRAGLATARKFPMEAGGRTSAEGRGRPRVP